MNVAKPIGIILAAGRGSRLAPITDTVPKPLIEVRGKTLLVHTVEPLAPHISELVIVVGYMKDRLTNELGATFADLPVTYPVQENPKAGTLDALRVAVRTLTGEQLQNGCIVVSADDIHSSSAFTQLGAHARDNNQEMMLVGASLEDKEAVKRFGVFEVDTTGKVIGLIEKPENPPSQVINCALYYFPPAFIDSIFDEYPTMPNGELYIPSAVNDWMRKYGSAFIVSDSWEPVGTHEELAAARSK